MINKYSILNGAKYFSSDGLQNYLVCISTRRNQSIKNTGKVDSWGSTGMSKERIKNQHTSEINSSQLIGEYRFSSKVKFKGICLKQDSFFIVNCILLMN